VKRALLDVNVLLALLDSDHIDHVRARDWLDAEIGTGWASLPITENGFVRIISQPCYPSPVSPTEGIEVGPCVRQQAPHVPVARSQRARCSGRGPHSPTRATTGDRSLSLAAVHGATEEHLTVL
jgi:hypothetical protein